MEGDPRHFFLPKTGLIFIAILQGIVYFAYHFLCKRQMMRSFSISFIFLFISAASFAQELLPLDQVRPGMRGVGRTVFSGYHPEEFEVEAVEVVRNFHPKRNLILVRLAGKKAEFTGVAAGMSGSPIYLDGKLAGALSYSVGIFMKEPLAGVTPIYEMLEIFDRESAREHELAALSFAPAPDQFLEMALGLKQVAWQDFAPSSPALRPAAGAGLQPLALPLSFSGVSSDLLSQIDGLLRPLGFMAVGGGAAMSSLNAENDSVKASDLVPGAAIGAVIVTGDLSIEALGTVTYRDDKKVLAFGHPFFSNGPIDIPVSLAKVLTVVASEYSAYKIGASALLVGALRQDRTTGVYAEIGALPRMVPMSVRYTDEAGRESRFSYQFTDERSINTLMPLLLRMVLMNTLQSARLANGENSLALQGELRFQDGQKIKLENFYAGMTPVAGLGYLSGVAQSTGEIAATLGAVMASSFPPVPLKEIELHFTSLPGWRSASVEQVWVDRSTVQAGDTITVSARVQAYRGATVLVRQNLVVPKTVTGQSLVVVVGGGRELTQLDQRTLPGRFAADNFQKLASLLNAKRRSDLLYFQLRAPDRGVVIEGEELASLPPTAYAILQSQTAKGKVFPAREHVLTEANQRIDIPESSLKKSSSFLPCAVSGTQTIRLRLR
jgi:hypothetical protein